MKNKFSIKQFNKIFNKGENPDVFFAPGRINLIGEHLDYNGGLVMPISISLGTYGYAVKNDDATFNVASKNFEKDGIVSFNLETLEKDNIHTWINYIKGVVSELKKDYDIKYGFNLYLTSDLPLGGGLSSSASLEVLIINIIKRYNNLDIDNIEVAKLGQRVENNYMGLKSGIMDQFAVANGKDNKALLLNTNTLEFKYIPFILPEEYDLVIGFTNKERKLVESKYNERYAECMSARDKLKEVLPKIKTLAEVSEIELEQNKSVLTEIEYKRAKHVTTEQARVMLSSSFLEKNDFKNFCALLEAGHKSLDIYYEVAGIELNTLVYTALKNGAIGARLTGAGFGGSMFFIIPKTETTTAIKNITKEYKKTVGYRPIFYTVEVKGASFE